MFMYVCVRVCLCKRVHADDDNDDHDDDFVHMVG